MEFIIWSKENCPHCTRAVFKLTQANLPFRELKVGTDFSREELLEKFPNARTYPQIEFNSGIETIHIGGADDLEKWLNRPIESETWQQY
jgi:glutaredoxin